MSIYSIGELLATGM